MKPRSCVSGMSRILTKILGPCQFNSSTSISRRDTSLIESDGVILKPRIDFDIDEFLTNDLSDLRRAKRRAEAI